MSSKKNEAKKERRADTIPSSTAHRALLQNSQTVQPPKPDFTKRRPGSMSRSILAALLIFNFAFLISARATITVTGLVSQITSETLETKIMFTPAADILLLTNGLSAGPAKTISSAANGGFTNTFNPGTYLVRLPLVSGRNAFTISVPHGSGIENITNLIAAPWTYEQFVNTIPVSGGTSGALTNNETRAVTLANGLTVSGTANLPTISGATASISAISAVTVTASGGISGPGTGLTAIPDAAVASTIARDTELVAADTVVSNGVVSGIAAGSYAINGVLATNLIEATGAYSPQHFNIGKTPVLNGLIRSNLPVRMLVFGDDAFIPTTGIISAFTNMGYKVNGTGGGSTYQIGNYAYADAAGTTTYIEADGVANQYVIGTVGMATGSSLTNVVQMGQSQGLDTDRIAIKYWHNTGFGTLGVYTNSYGSTPSLLTTIDCNVGSFTYSITNFDMPARISNCVVSVRSVGTNFVPVAAIAQWKTNGAVLRLDQYTGGNVGIFNFTESVIKSNIFRTLLTDFDVLVVSDLGGGDYAYGTNLWGMIKENNLKLDVVIATSIIQSNNGAYDSRAAALNIGRTTPFVVVDTAALFAPTNAATLNYFYDDTSHLSRMGQAYAGEKFANVLGWNADNFRQSLPNQTTNYFFIAADELRNQSGALTLSDIYTVLGAPYRTWAHYVAAGTYGANATLVYPGNQLGQRKRVYARMLVLTTNAISYSLLLNHAVFPVGTNITSWSVPVNDLGSFTLGNSGQTNISYTEWQGINPTVRGPWAGWLQVGFGATSKAYACWLLGVEFRADPDNAWDNW